MKLLFSRQPKVFCTKLDARFAHRIHFKATSLFESLETRLMLSVAPASVAGDVITILAAGGTNGSIPPQAERITISATTISLFNLIDSSPEGASSYTYTANGDTATIVVAQPDHTATVSLTFTSTDGGTYATDIGGGLETQSGTFLLQTPPFAKLAPASIATDNLSFTIDGGGGSLYQTSGTDSVVFNTNKTFGSSSDVGSSDGTYSYTQTVGATPGDARIVTSSPNSGDPNVTNFLNLVFTSATSGAFYRTDATEPNGQSALNDYQYGTFTLAAAPAPATHLAVSTIPATVGAGQTLNSVTISVEDAKGNVVAADNSNVTVSLLKSNATLHGTLTVQAVNGVANFSDLSINQIGSYKLLATDGALKLAKPSAFTITPDLTTAHLVLSQTLPTTVLVGESLAQTITVQLEDQFNNLIKTDKSAVTLSIATGPGNAAIQGAATLNFKNGEATFKKISLSQAGNYTLQLLDATLPGAGGTPTPLSLQVTQATTTLAPPHPAKSYKTNHTIKLTTVLKSNAPTTIPFTGIVTLTDQNSNILGTANVTSKGTLQFLLAALPAGIYTCTAAYPGDTNHAAVTSSTFTLTVTN
jgi:hypothetical protein